jgi:hypothetical protein
LLRRRKWKWTLVPSKSDTTNFESKYYDYGTYWADFGFTFSPGFEFKGAYYMQDHDGPNKV